MEALSLACFLPIVRKSLCSLTLWVDPFCFSKYSVLVAETNAFYRNPWTDIDCFMYFGTVTVFRYQWITRCCDAESGLANMEFVLLAHMIALGCFFEGLKYSVMVWRQGGGGKDDGVLYFKRQSQLEADVFSWYPNVVTMSSNSYVFMTYDYDGSVVRYLVLAEYPLRSWLAEVGKTNRLQRSYYIKFLWISNQAGTLMVQKVYILLMGARVSVLFSSPRDLVFFWTWSTSALIMADQSRKTFAW